MSITSARDFDWLAREEVVGEHGLDPKDPRDGRTQYQRDRDRVVHAVAFRRLQGKTQVFASGWADPMRTRLTHTIEVAQIGRAIAQYHGVPGELVEAACLAHDLGHPPFGHVGEKALNDLMIDSGGFDSNAQSFRIVTELEDKKADYAGLNLSRGVLLGMLKYPFLRSGEWPAETPPPPRAHLQRGTGDEWIARRHFLYDGQSTFAEWLFRGTQLSVLPVSRRGETPPRTLPCAVVDWADDIAYSVHDLEDGLLAGFLDPSTFTRSDTLKAVYTNLTSAPIAWQDRAPPSQEDVFTELQRLQLDLEHAVRVARRGALREVTRGYINQFILCTTVEILGRGETAFDLQLVIPERERIRASILKALTFEFVLKDPRITRYLYKGRLMLERLFRAFMEDPKIIDDSRDQLFDQRLRERLNLVADVEYHRQRVFADYLSGITEREAIALYQTMFESTGGSPLR